MFLGSSAQKGKRGVGVGVTSGQLCLCLNINVCLFFFILQDDSFKIKLSQKSEPQRLQRWIKTDEGLTEAVWSRGSDVLHDIVEPASV